LHPSRHHLFPHEGARLSTGKYRICPRQCADCTGLYLMPTVAETGLRKDRRWCAVPWRGDCAGSGVNVGAAGRKAERDWHKKLAQSSSCSSSAWQELSSAHAPACRPAMLLPNWPRSSSPSARPISAVWYANMLRHDVAFWPDVDVRGRLVKSADLNARSIKLPEQTAIDITVKVFYLLGAARRAA